MGCGQEGGGREACLENPWQFKLVISLSPCPEQVLPWEQAPGSLQFGNGLTSAVGGDLPTPALLAARKGSQAAPLRRALVTLQRQHMGHVSGALAVRRD